MHTGATFPQEGDQSYPWLTGCSRAEGLTERLALVFVFSTPSGVELPTNLVKSKEMWESGLRAWQDLCSSRFLSVSAPPACGSSPALLGGVVISAPASSPGRGKVPSGDGAELGHRSGDQKLGSTGQRGTLQEGQTPWVP